MDQQSLHNYSEYFKALAHPVRLKILYEIIDNCYNLNSIMERFNMSQPAVSQHLGKMRRLGIIKSEKTGTNMCYKIINEEILKILKILKKEDVS